MCGKIHSGELEMVCDGNMELGGAEEVRRRGKRGMGLWR